MSTSTSTRQPYAATEVRHLTPSDDEYPAHVVAAYTAAGDVAPDVWVMGAPLPDASTWTPVVAVTGSRASTSYGDHVATEVATQVAARGAVVVTGGAFGIDVAATRGALVATMRQALTGQGEAVPGPVIVAAAGVDRPYPTAHREVFALVVEHGGTVVSLVEPGTPPSRSGFLARSRFMSALASAVIVVEAAAASSAVKVALQAQDDTRRVYAVPGPITSAASAGTNRLIAEGYAYAVTDVATVADRVTGR